MTRPATHGEPAHPDGEPHLPSREDTDQGWDEAPDDGAEAARLSWWQSQRPPHWE